MFFLLLIPIAGHFGTMGALKSWGIPTRHHGSFKSLSHGPRLDDDWSTPYDFENLRPPELRS